MSVIDAICSLSPKTQAHCIAQAAIIYPAHCIMPKTDPGDATQMAAQDLINTLNNSKPKAPFSLKTLHNQALCYIADIFQYATKMTTSSEGVHSPSTMIRQPHNHHYLKTPQFPE
jgi:hypothetical protein